MLQNHTFHQCKGVNQHFYGVKCSHNNTEKSGIQDKIRTTEYIQKEKASNNNKSFFLRKNIAHINTQKTKT